MKHIIQFSLYLLLFIGCREQEASPDHKILDEYLLLNYKSWSYMRNAGYDMIPQYNINDTIELKSAIRLMIIPNDTIEDIPITPENFRDFEESTRIVLVTAYTAKFYRHVFNFITIDSDSTIRGMITSDDLSICQEGPMSPVTEKNMFLQKLINERNQFDERIVQLADKYNMTEDSLISVLAKQYYEKTGNAIFGH